MILLGIMFGLLVYSCTLCCDDRYLREHASKKQKEDEAVMVGYYDDSADSDSLYPPLVGGYDGDSTSSSIDNTDVENDTETTGTHSWCCGNKGGVEEKKDERIKNPKRISKNNKHKKQLKDEPCITACCGVGKNDDEVVECRHGPGDAECEICKAKKSGKSLRGNQ